MRANIISFQVYIDSNGNLMTDFSKLQEKGLDLFDVEDRVYVEKALREATVKLEGLHNYLQKELQAL